MPKILIESKMLENNKNGVLKLRINNERVEELKNVKKTHSKKQKKHRAWCPYSLLPEFPLFSPMKAPVSLP